MVVGEIEHLEVVVDRVQRCHLADLVVRDVELLEPRVQHDRNDVELRIRADHTRLDLVAHTATRTDRGESANRTGQCEN